jgi:hypothetical protein
MLPNAFIGRAAEPADKELAAVLGSAKKTWDGLIEALVQEQGIDGREWKSYSIKAGWSLRLIKKGRVIVYLSPHRGSFTASFALGDKAVQAALKSKLPPPAVKIIKEAKRYAEGTAVRIEVLKAKDVGVVRTLAAIKLAH